MSRDETRRSATPVLMKSALGLLFLIFSISCQQRMADQPRVEPLSKSDFFADERGARPLVKGTVARGQLRADTHLYEGTVNGKPVEIFPFSVDSQVLMRGRERYNIFCVPCHDEMGTGQGMIVRRGFRSPPSFHTDRLRRTPVGMFFDHMTNGFGAMPDYAQQIPPADRWAIIAYIRVLQLSQNARIADVPASERGGLEATK